MPQPWERDAIVGQAAPPRQPDPIIKPRDPYKASAEARAQQDQAMQRARDDRQTAQWNASHNPDGSEKPKVVTDGKPTEFQAKSAGFLGRMVQAEKMFGAVPPDSRDARTMTGQTLHEWAPSMENSLPVWLGGNSSERQGADQAALNFISASLRQESGAAIGPAEYDKQYRIFFPMPGDTEAQIKQKAEARRQAIDGFRVAAGPLAPRIEQGAGAKRLRYNPKTGKIE